MPGYVKSHSLGGELDDQDHNLEILLKEAVSTQEFTSPDLSFQNTLSSYFFFECYSSLGESNIAGVYLEKARDMLANVENGAKLSLEKEVLNVLLYIRAQ